MDALSQVQAYLTASSQQMIGLLDHVYMQPEAPTNKQTEEKNKVLFDLILGGQSALCRVFIWIVVR